MIVCTHSQDLKGATGTPSSAASLGTSLPDAPRQDVDHTLEFEGTEPSHKIDGLTQLPFNVRGDIGLSPGRGSTFSQRDLNHASSRWQSVLQRWLEESGARNNQRLNGRLHVLILLNRTCLIWLLRLGAGPGSSNRSIRDWSFVLVLIVSFPHFFFFTYCSGGENTMATRATCSPQDVQGKLSYYSLDNFLFRSYRRKLWMLMFLSIPSSLHHSWKIPMNICKTS